MDEIVINKNEYDDKFDMEEDQQTFVFIWKTFFSLENEYLSSWKKLKEAKLDEQFPDEVDTPMDIPARIRFQKYFTWLVYPRQSHSLVDIVVWRVFEQQNGMSKRIYQLITEEYINFQIVDRWSNRTRGKSKTRWSCSSATVRHFPCQRCSTSTILSFDLCSSIPVYFFSFISIKSSSVFFR